jgi:hypothetical protein
MLNPMRTTCAKTRPQPAKHSALLFASLAILTGACIVTPHPSLAGDNLADSSLSVSAVKCSPAPDTSSKQCHLDLNDRMKMDLGTWASNIVHPHGQNYFCVERHKQLEQQRSRGCR